MINESFALMGGCKMLKTIPYWQKRGSKKPESLALLGAIML